jgi:hypothetical protein
MKHVNSTWLFFEFANIPHFLDKTVIVSTNYATESAYGDSVEMQKCNNQRNLHRKRRTKNVAQKTPTTSCHGSMMVQQTPKR